MEGGIDQDRTHVFTVLTGKRRKRSWSLEDKGNELDVGPAEFLVPVDHPARDIQKVRQSEGASGLWIWSEEVAVEDLRRGQLAQGG